MHSSLLLLIWDFSSSFNSPLLISSGIIKHLSFKEYGNFCSVRQPVTLRQTRLISDHLFCGGTCDAAISTRQTRQSRWQRGDSGEGSHITVCAGHASYMCCRQGDFGTGAGASRHEIPYNLSKVGYRCGAMPNHLANHQLDL
ncbi:hypothetical protein B0T24DRAFT_610224 [Lasiosphaeria ovina]|uniref:Secreted protein n=1 Tax=Lasiosphaeria ovina TaxID=92902 RepID=A0AAE0KLI8_9PEZI|nr:hypothetical protein B0T24DRAFT_610224 [Lasiosphaeria ovina]